MKLTIDPYWILELNPKKLSLSVYFFKEDLILSNRDWNNEFLRLDLKAYPGTLENLETLLLRSFLID